MLQQADPHLRAANLKSINDLDKLARRALRHSLGSENRWLVHRFSIRALDLYGFTANYSLAGYREHISKADNSSLDAA